LAVAEHKAPLAVELLLEDPVPAHGSGRCRGGEHGLHPGGLLAGDEPFLLFFGQGGEERMHQGSVVSS